jgi:hypothetical protein
MKDLVRLDNGEYGLANDVIVTIMAIEKEIKKLKELQDSYKEQLLKDMEEYEVLKIDIPELTITRKMPTTRESLDTKLLRAEQPDIYDEYVRISDVKGSITIKVKENE